MSDDLWWLAGSLVSNSLNLSVKTHSCLNSF